FDVEGGFAHANQYAVPICNVGAAFRGAFPFAGTTIEVDPTNVGLTMLHGVPGFVGLTSATGRFRSAPLTLPAPLGGAQGAYLGVEFLLFDSSFALVGSTGAQWVLID